MRVWRQSWHKSCFSTSIKRWADEGVLPSIRTAGGHRRFNRSAVVQFSKRGSTNESESKLVDEWVDLFSLENDTQIIANKIVGAKDETSDWYQVAELLGQVIGRIGERWEEGDIGIAEEHLISRRFQRAIEIVTNSIALPEKSPSCVLSTLSGERHTLGLVLAQLCMRAVGYETFWVGEDTPPDDLCELIEKLKPNVVILSASGWSTDHHFLLKSYQLLSTTCRKLNVELGLGGTGAWPEDPDYGHRCKSFEDLKALQVGSS